MAIIEVNYQALRDTANTIDAYCETHDREMKKADSAVKQMLSGDWTGPDSMEFGGKWESVDSGDSASVQFRKSMESYSKALRACANVYQEAHESVYNMAALLLK